MYCSKILKHATRKFVHEWFCEGKDGDYDEWSRRSIHQMHQVVLFAGFHHPQRLFKTKQIHRFECKHVPKLHLAGKLISRQARVRAHSRWYKSTTWSAFPLAFSDRSLFKLYESSSTPFKKLAWCDGEKHLETSFLRARCICLSLKGRLSIDFFAITTGDLHHTEKVLFLDWGGVTIESCF